MISNPEHPANEDNIMAFGAIPELVPPKLFEASIIMEGHRGLSDSNTIFPLQCVVILSAIINTYLLNQKYH
jgi:hypothetical protein